MRMLFRTFGGYVNEKQFGYITKKYCSPSCIDECTPDVLGKDIVFECNRSLNCSIRKGNGGYHELRISNMKNWHDLFVQCVKFMEEFMDIGCVTFYNDDGISQIITESVHMNAYDKDYPDGSFFILFNARLTSPYVYEHSIVIGYDLYSIVYEPHSIVVWDLDKFEWFNDGTRTLWGVRQNTGMPSMSLTDDVVVGIRGNNVCYALR